MIELIVIWRLAVSIGNLAHQKGLKKIGYQTMTVALWVCGELFGGILGSVILGTNGSFWVIYILALFGAIVGAGISFLVMSLLPKQGLSVNINELDSKQEMTGFQKFGRSGCVPALIIFSAFFCVVLGFFGSVIIKMWSVFPQTHATNLIIGTELGNDGQILQSVTDISSDTDIIYLSFDYVTVEGMEPPVTVDWITNGQIIYSSFEYLKQGKIVTQLNRKQLGLSEFPKGNYEVNIHIEYAPLATTTFRVK